MRMVYFIFLLYMKNLDRKGINSMKKALIGMSGGVDSSVSAYFMQKEGYECIGATMHLYDNEDIGIAKEKTCCSLSDVDDARAVATLMGIPFYVLNFKEDFKEKVIQNFVRAYEQGNTPNPCIDCNRHMKFNRFYKKAMEIGCDYVVTGHYARIEYDQASGRYLLKKAVDDTKDQSYVLYSLTQEQLAHAKFPLGGFTKEEVRKVAEEQGFVNAKKSDSQDICFVPDGDYAGFIERTTGKKYLPGDFVNESGEKVGNHKGIIHYTIGQRKGLGIAADMPYYVAGIDVEKNQVILTKDPNKSGSVLYATELNWISIEDLKEGEVLPVKARIRYKHKEAPATVEKVGEDLVKVTFAEPVRAITKGQSVVFYDEDLVVGGGIICGAE